MSLASSSVSPALSPLLAIETSSETCSVALFDGGDLAVKSISGAKRHAESVLVFIDELLETKGLAKSALRGVAYGRGPGAFTGVRLSVAVTQGLAFALDLPTFGVSTLLACALDALDQHRELGNGQPFWVLLDARMGELYSAQFDVRNGLPVLIGEERLVRFAHWQDQYRVHESVPGQYCVGSGAILHQTALSEMGIKALAAEPSASAVARLAQAIDAQPAHLAQPVYLRNQVALTIAERKLAAELKAAAAAASANT